MGAVKRHLLDDEHDEQPNVGGSEYSDILYDARPPSKRKRKHAHPCASCGRMIYQHNAKRCGPCSHDARQARARERAAQYRGNRRERLRTTREAAHAERVEKLSYYLARELNIDIAKQWPKVCRVVDAILKGRV
jgi:hypothetical protein